MTTEENSTGGIYNMTISDNTDFKFYLRGDNNIAPWPGEMIDDREIAVGELSLDGKYVYDGEQWVFLNGSHDWVPEEWNKDIRMSLLEEKISEISKILEKVVSRLELAENFDDDLINDLRKLTKTEHPVVVPLNQQTLEEDLFDI